MRLLDFERWKFYVEIVESITVSTEGKFISPTSFLYIGKLGSIIKEIEWVHFLERFELDCLQVTIMLISYYDGIVVDQLARVDRFL